MPVTYSEYMKTNPDVIIIGGRDLDHEMEHDEHTGFETCNRCGLDVTDADEVCPTSDYSVYNVTDWDDYVEIEPGVARFRLEQN